MEYEYRLIAITGVRVGDIFIRRGSGEECELLSVIDQPNEKDKRIFMFNGFCAPTRMLEFLFECESREFCRSLFKIKNIRREV